MLLAKSFVVALSIVLAQSHFCSKSDYYFTMRYMTPYQHYLPVPRAMDLQTFAATVSRGRWWQLLLLEPFRPSHRLLKRFTGEVNTNLQYLLSKNFRALFWNINFRSGTRKGNDGECRSFKNKFYSDSKHFAIFRGFDGALMPPKAGRIRETRFFSSKPSVYIWTFFCMDVHAMHHGRCAAGEGFLSLQVRNGPNRLPWDLIADDLRCEMQLFPDDKRFRWTYFGNQPCLLRKPTRELCQGKQLVTNKNKCVSKPPKGNKKNI